MKKILASGVIAIAAVALLATSFSMASAEEPSHPCPFFENLTEDQKEALMEKKEEMRDFKEELKDLEPEERRERMQELREDFKQWAEDNDINFGFVRGPGKGYMKGFRGHKPCLAE